MEEIIIVVISIVFSIIYFVGCGLLGGYINERKGCKYWTGFWCGFLLGIFGLIIIVVQKNKNPNVNMNNNIVQNNANELKTYKELLDSGAITQDEFDQKKKQLLNL